MLSGSLSTPSAKLTKLAEASDYSDGYYTIATFTATTTTDTVTFSSIPQDYQDLHFRIVGSGVTGANSSMLCNFNGRANTHNVFTRVNFNANQQRITANNGFMGYDMTETANHRTIWEGWFNGYSSTILKTAYWLMGSTSPGSSDYMSAAAVFNTVDTAPITSLVFSHNQGSNSIAAGTSFTLYGVL